MTGKIKHSSLADQIYDLLLKQVIDGQKKAGEKISEESVSGEFGVSRTPAREALLRLHRDGIVERVPRCGCFVGSFDATAAQELYQYRKIVECAALELGFDLIDREQLRLLKAEIATADGDRNKSLEIDERLHNIIVAACPNRYLMESAKKLINRTRAFRSWRASEAGDINIITGERRAIIQAIIDGEMKRAVELLGEHICNGEAFMNGLTGKEENGN